MPLHTGGLARFVRGKISGTRVTLFEPTVVGKVGRGARCALVGRANVAQRTIPQVRQFKIWVAMYPMLCVGSVAHMSQKRMRLTFFGILAVAIDFVVMLVGNDNVGAGHANLFPDKIILEIVEAVSDGICRNVGIRCFAVRVRQFLGAQIAQDVARQIIDRDASFARFFTVRVCRQAGVTIVYNDKRFFFHVI